MKTTLSLITLVLIGYVLYRLFKKDSGGDGFGLGSGTLGGGLLDILNTNDSRTIGGMGGAGSGSISVPAPNDPYADKTPLQKLTLANNIADIAHINKTRGKISANELWNLKMLAYSLNNTPTVTLRVVLPQWLKSNGYRNLSESALVKSNINDSNYQQLVDKLKKIN